MASKVTIRSMAGGMAVYFSIVAVLASILAYGYLTRPATDDATVHGKLVKPQY